MAHLTRVNTALEKDLKFATDDQKKAFVEASAAFRDSRVNEAIKQATLTQQAAVDAAKKQLADVAAAGKQLVFETTGDLAALEAAFAQRCASIIAASQADLKRQSAANKVPGQEGAITAAVQTSQAAALQALAARGKRVHESDFNSTYIGTTV